MSRASRYEFAGGHDTLLALAALAAIPELTCVDYYMDYSIRLALPVDIELKRARRQTVRLSVRAE